MKPIIAPQRSSSFRTIVMPVHRTSLWSRIVFLATLLSEAKERNMKVVTITYT